jgi:citrate lyase subunit beta/citryl-CoA lyase
MAASLGAVRSRRGGELAYVRSRFLVECRAAGVEAIDCPYTFSDVEGAAADARYARRLGYRMKSLVDPAHAAAVKRALTPNLARARGSSRRSRRRARRARTARGWTAR